MEETFSLNNSLMDYISETFSFLDDTVFPQLAQQWRNQQNIGDEQILPHRLPLKRRLAEYRHGSHNRRGSTTVALPNPSPTLTSNLWAIERFRDITPALVVAVFDDYLVLEPGDVGPLPLTHPVARELVRCINGQLLTIALLRKLRECGSVLYDGCAVIGIVDYRRWAFTTVTSGGGTVPPTSSVAPEMHKILLKPDFATIMTDIDAFVKEESHSGIAPEIEAKILVLLLLFRFLIKWSSRCQSVLLSV